MSSTSILTTTAWRSIDSNPVKFVFQKAFCASKDFIVPYFNCARDAESGLEKFYISDYEDQIALYVVGFENLRSKEREGLSKILDVIEKFLDNRCAVSLYLARNLDVFDGQEDEITVSGKELYAHLIRLRGTEDVRSSFSRAMSNLRSQSLTHYTEDSTTLQKRTVRAFNRVRKFGQIVAQQEKIAALHSQYKAQEKQMNEMSLLYGSLTRDNYGAQNGGMSHSNGEANAIDNISKNISKCRNEMVPILNQINRNIKAEKKKLTQLEEELFLIETLA